MEKLYGRIQGLGYTVKMTEEAKDFIADKGFDANLGARPLKRAIQKYVEDPLAEEIITNNPTEGDNIELELDTEKQEIKIKISKPGVSKPNKKKKDDQ